MPQFFYRDKNIYFTNGQCFVLNMILSVSDTMSFTNQLKQKLHGTSNVNGYQSINEDEYNWLKENSIFLK